VIWRAIFDDLARGERVGRIVEEGGFVLLVVVELGHLGWRRFDRLGHLVGLVIV